MKHLPWLVQAAGPGPARMRARRTEEASRDLAALADRIRGSGLHLVIEDQVDLLFTFEARHLPAGTVDGRRADALGAALDDPSAVLITIDGPYVGLAVGRDPRLARACRPRPLAWTPRRERVVRVVPRARRGRSARRTTLGFVAHHADGTTRHRSLIDAIQWTERLPVTVTSASHDAASLAALLADADRLVPPSLVLNGRRFEAP